MHWPASPPGTVCPVTETCPWQKLKLVRWLSVSFSLLQGYCSCLGLNLCSESWKFFPVSFCRPSEKSNCNERLRARRHRDGERTGERRTQNEEGTGEMGAAEPKAASRRPETHLPTCQTVWFGLRSWLQKFEAPRSKLIEVCNPSLPFYVQGKSE